MIPASFSTLVPLSGVIDLDYLAEVTQGDIVFAREVLALFSAQARGLSAALVRTGDDVGAQTHKLKGSAAGIGAIRVLEAAARLEGVMRHGGEATMALGGLKRAVRDACAAIDVVLLSASP
ncbi:MAG: Hpt domain-containing protein [Alphaproteobacteria bacterium]|nr:Hpt domain-containing protein [Alphaproteobacteria bacterium]